MAQADMQIEVFETESGEGISLKDAYFSGMSLNYHDIQCEGIRYMTEGSFESYLVKGHMLEVEADGTWQGTEVLDKNDDWEDRTGGENFVWSGVGIHILDDKPIFRLYLAQEEGSTNYTKAVFNLSPLTIATPEGPTKSATITG